MEIRPFRALRFSPETIEKRGLPALVAAAREPGGAVAPENAALLLYPAASGETLKSWIGNGTLVKERRPALWAYRQTHEGAGRTRVIDLLLALARLTDDIEVPVDAPPAEDRSKRVGWIAETKADFEPSLVITRAPLSAALSSTRRPDLSAVDGRGVRHDVRRLPEYAQHVELQGLVKNAEAIVVAGLEAFEAARQFSRGPAAARLPGARYKLCAIVAEKDWKDSEDSIVVPAGLAGFSMEDAVY
jgi:hypothetical protein